MSWFATSKLESSCGNWGGPMYSTGPGLNQTSMEVTTPVKPCTSQITLLTGTYLINIVLFSE